MLMWVCSLRLKQNAAVKFVALYCLIGFIVVQVLYLSVWCRPIQQYWAVPVVNRKLLHMPIFTLLIQMIAQCATYYNHMITATVFNVSSDLMMLLIPLPLLLTSKLPLKRYLLTPCYIRATDISRKLILSGVFSLGIFVVRFLLPLLLHLHTYTTRY